MMLIRLLIIICTSIGLTTGSVEAQCLVDASQLVDTKGKLAKAIATLSIQLELNEQITAKNLTLSSQEYKPSRPKLLGAL